MPSDPTSDPSSDPTEQPLSVFRHEAGTPLAVIGGALRQLDRTDLVPEQRELLQSALRQWEVLQRLLDQLQVADQDELQLEREELDLGAFVAEIVEDLADTVLSAHHCDVEVADAPVLAAADPVRLRQVLFNLLDNAAKYSPDGTQVHVTVRRDGDRAEIAVTDEGTGLSDPDTVRIFRRYERASEESEGLGLGLYVVWRIIEAHGGRIRAEPAPEGSGARFIVHLPAVGR